MGQQQLLIIILGAIIVGIAIGVGIVQFGSSNIQANKDGVTSSLITIAADAYQFKIRPRTLGGGSGVYGTSGGAAQSYMIPRRMLSDDNGRYTVATAQGNICVLKGTSKLDSSWVATCVIDSNGVTTMQYHGW